VKDNFFEIGGHSLKATRVIMQIRKTFNVGIDMKSVFLEPTIEVLADKINNDTWLQAVMVEDEEHFDEIKV
jgi:acyl carrier protein